MSTPVGKSLPPSASQKITVTAEGYIKLPNGRQYKLKVWKGDDPSKTLQLNQSALKEMAEKVAEMLKETKVAYKDLSKVVISKEEIKTAEKTIYMSDKNKEFYKKISSIALKALKLKSPIPDKSKLSFEEAKPSWEKLNTYGGNRVGALIDDQDNLKLPREKIQEHLNKLIPENMRAEKMEAGKPDPFDPFKNEHFEEQSTKGLCGVHAFNNSFGQEKVKHEDYIRWLRKWLVEHTALNQQGVDALTDKEIDTPPEAYPDFLKEQGIQLKDDKPVKVGNLPGYSDDQVKTLNDFIGNAERFWIGNVERGEVHVPSREAGVNSIGGGHFVCARKDQVGQWWLIDSRRIRKVPLKHLSLLHKDLYIFVPS